MAKPNILGITLARGGSKSVPRKNVLPLGGLPMIGHTIREALKSKHLTRFIISTDDDEIAQISRRMGAMVPFMRPAELATDTATSKDCLVHATGVMEEMEGKPYDYIVELMVTSPFKTVQDIDGAIEKLISTGADSVIGVVRIWDHHPARVKKVVDDKLVDFCVKEIPDSRRQDLKPEAYVRNGSIYAMRRDVLMVQGARYGTADSRPYVMPEERSINVDGPLDFLAAEAMLKGKEKK